LIESSERVTFEEDTLGELIGDMPVALRITSIGAYHLHRWCHTFAYLDAMAFDTPVFKDEYFQEMAKGSESLDIQHRLARADAFSSYLKSCWDDAGLTTPYFDWNNVQRQISDSFEEVRRGLARQSARRVGS
jgi:hypothetical protein